MCTIDSTQFAQINGNDFKTILKFFFRYQVFKDENLKYPWKSCPYLHLKSSELSLLVLKNHYNDFEGGTKTWQKEEESPHCNWLQFKRIFIIMIIFVILIIILWKQTPRCEEVFSHWGSPTRKTVDTFYLHAITSHYKKNVKFKFCQIHTLL